MVQDEVGIRGGDDPRSFADLPLELARPPPRVAGITLEATGLQMAQPGQGPGRSAHVESVHDGTSLRVRVLGRVDDEALLRLDRSSLTDPLVRIPRVGDLM